MTGPDRLAWLKVAAMVAPLLLVLLVLGLVIR